VIVTGRDGSARLEDVPIGKVAIFFRGRCIGEAWVAADRETEIGVLVRADSGPGPGRN